MCRKKTVLLCMFLATISFIDLIQAQSDGKKSFLDDSEILARWEESYGRIKSMRVAYRTRLVKYQQPKIQQIGPDEEFLMPIEHNEVERVEQGRHYLLRYSLAAEGLSNPEWLVEYSFDGKIAQSYSGSSESGWVSLEQRRGGNEQTMNDLKSFMFLMTKRVPDALKDEYPDGIPELAYWFKLGKLRAKVVVRPILEYIAGEPCHVVELIDDSDYGGKPREIKKIFWLAHNKGMCVMKYQMLWNGKVESEIEIATVGEVELDGRNLWYPQKAYRTLNSDRFGTTKRELTVTEFVPNVNIDEKTFRLNYESGTHVLARPSMISYKWRDGMKFIADELTNSIRYVPEDWSIMVGAGKPLPTFEDIETGLSDEQLKNKSILLCFFDSEQRPSRNCLQQLSVKEHKLAEEDVLLVAIHPSTNDRIKLYEWLKEHNIQIALGTINADIEKTKFTWGVRALPWLILTDNKHVVTAEGFSVAQLDDKLRSKSNP